MIELKNNNQIIEVKKNNPVDLLESTKNHIEDVLEGMQFFSNMMIHVGENHDDTKIQRFNEFSEALASGKIRESEWFQDHINLERHHLNDCVPDDVNLVDVFEHLIDCVMAGFARTGIVHDIHLPAEVLEKAHQNTINLLKRNIIRYDNPDISDSII